jgi:hypothetical protein
VSLPTARKMIEKEDKEFDALFEMVESALGSSRGRAAVENTTIYLRNQLNINGFNSVRATEVYSMTIDNVMWTFLKDNPSRRIIYSYYRSSRINQEFGKQLTDIFTGNGSIRDQRPVRARFRWLLGS